MLRQAGIDAPGTLHHVILRGIERKAIFKIDVLAGYVADICGIKSLTRRADTSGKIFADGLAPSAIIHRNFRVSMAREG